MKKIVINEPRKERAGLLIAKPYWETSLIVEIGDGTRYLLATVFGLTEKKVRKRAQLMAEALKETI